MKFSVVTISFNQASFLERAILSVISQQSVDLEYIVVDPGSTDGSRAIIEKYRPQISKVVYEPDHGPADGLNNGLAHATGELFGYLNADDEYLPDALQCARRIFLDNPSASVVYGNGLQIDEFGHVKARMVSDLRVSGALYARGLTTIVQQAAFMRTSALRQIGGFNPNNHTSWDGEAFALMAQNGHEFIRAWRYWGLFRIYDGSISGSGRLNAQYKIDRDRLFSNFFGRSPTFADYAFWRVARLALLCSDPRGLFTKLSRKLGR